MSDLRDAVIKVAYKKPELRKHLLPLVKESATSFSPLGSRGGEWWGRRWKDSKLVKVDERKAQKIMKRPAGRDGVKRTT